MVLSSLKSELSHCCLVVIADDYHRFLRILKKCRCSGPVSGVSSRTSSSSSVAWVISAVAASIDCKVMCRSCHSNGIDSGRSLAGGSGKSTPGNCA